MGELGILERGKDNGGGDRELSEYSVKVGGLSTYVYVIITYE